MTHHGVGELQDPIEVCDDRRLRLEVEHRVVALIEVIDLVREASFPPEVGRLDVGAGI